MQSTLPATQVAAFDTQGIAAVIASPRQAVHVVVDPASGALGVVDGASLVPATLTAVASLPPLYPSGSVIVRLLKCTAFVSHMCRVPWQMGLPAQGW